MTTQGLNLFIVDDNKLMVSTLKHYLQNRFGTELNISIFNDGESCLERVDKKTNIVILDYFMPGKNGLEILRSIKVKNPKTEVIMLSSNEDIGLAVDSFRVGAKDYILKGPKAWNRITKMVEFIITEPIRLLVREFKVSKFVAIFLLTFVTMGVVVVSVLRYMNWGS
jgi:two-component system response regulator AtoC